MRAERTYSALLIAALLCIQTHAVMAREDSTQLYERGARQALGGQIDEAIGSFTRCLELNPWYARAHYGIGKAYLSREGGLGNATRHLHRAVELDARMAPAHFYLGLAYMFERKYEEAVHSFQRAYGYDPAMIEALYNIASIYDYLGLEYKVKIFYYKYLAEKGE